MFTLVNLRRCYPCIIILAVIGLAQIYIFVMNEPFAGYVRTTFMSRQERPKSTTHLPNMKTDVATAVVDPNKPIHVLLISYARTGGSFVGDLLQSYPDVFYHFEPLHFFGGDMIDGTVPEAKLLLYRLFLCQASKIPGFMEWQETFKSLMKLERSHGYWGYCSSRGSCFDAKSMDSFCSGKSVIVVRTSRMTLREASALYDDFPDLNLKIVYLARDPRGTMNSRTRPFVRDWCKYFKTCYDPARFCSILSDDVDVVCRLLRQRPDDFVMVGYEELSREPYRYMNSLAHRLNYKGTEEMVKFLANHTTVPVLDAGDKLHFLYNTYRNSLMTSMMWRQEMKYGDAVWVQNECKKVLDAYGYHVYNSSDVMKASVHLDVDFIPSIDTHCSRSYISSEQYLNKR